MLLPSSSIYMQLYQYSLTAAVFSFTEISYDVNETAGPAIVVVELSGADLTFAINVTVETLGGGSATGTCVIICGLIRSQFMHIVITNNQRMQAKNCSLLISWHTQRFS